MNEDVAGQWLAEYQSAVREAHALRMRRARSHTDWAAAILVRFIGNSPFRTASERMFLRLAHGLWSAALQELRVIAMEANDAPDAARIFELQRALDGVVLPRMKIVPAEPDPWLPGSIREVKAPSPETEEVDADDAAATNPELEDLYARLSRLEDQALTLLNSMQSAETLLDEESDVDPSRRED